MQRKKILRLMGPVHLLSSTCICQQKFVCKVYKFSQHFIFCPMSFFYMTAILERRPQEKIPSTRYWILVPDEVSPIVYKATLFLTIWNIPHRRSPVLVCINKPCVPQKKIIMDKVERTKAKTKAKAYSLSTRYWELSCCCFLLFFTV